MVIDLRSDTVTKPTEEMYRAMVDAPLGDDVFGDDPTVHELESMAAQKLGREAALFLPSGTMANLVAVMSHTRRGDQIIVEASSHHFNWEAGGMSVAAGVMPYPIQGDGGYIRADQIRSAIRPENVHFCRTTLLMIENTHNASGGRCVSRSQMEEMIIAAHENGLKVHVDGARIFNASVALGVPVNRLTEGADSVSFCVSKGLSAPVGSLLCGSAEFIAEARRARKLLGGGLRQAGVLAACGIVALNTMIDRLREDHAHAKKAALSLAGMPGIDIRPDEVETNLVFFRLSDERLSVADVVDRCASKGLLLVGTPDGRIRMAFHRHIGEEETDLALNILRQVINA